MDQALDTVFPKKTLLQYSKWGEKFQVIRPLGNHWHTMGFPLDRTGNIYVLEEEALYLVEHRQAAYSLTEGTWSDDYDQLLHFCLKNSEFSLGKLAVYNHLKSLGYIMMDLYSPYYRSDEDDWDYSSYIVFKPNSAFQKKSPSGYLGSLWLVEASGNFAVCGMQKSNLRCITDTNAQVFLKIDDVTDKILLKRT